MFSIRSIKTVILVMTLLLVLAMVSERNGPVHSRFSHTREGSLSSLSCDPMQYTALKRHRKPADLPNLTVRFNDYALFFDRPSNTYLYSLTPGRHSSYAPSVSLSSGNGEYDVAFLSSPITDESIRKNTRHPFIVYNDTHYAEFFFSVTTLPVLSLETKFPEYSRDDFIGEKKSAVRLALFDNRETAGHLQRLIVSEADVKTRGATSLKFPQHSYKISLSYVSLGRNKRKHALSLLDMRRDKDWILYSPFNDPHKIRNIFSNNLWWEWGAANNSFGLENGSQGKFVELFINGRYQGIYGLMQPIDGPQLRIDKAKDLAVSDFYYRKIHNKLAVEQDLFTRGHRASSGGFEVRSPKNLKAAPEKWIPLAEYLRILGAPDDEFATNITGMVEMGNAIDLWLYINLVMGVDNITKNMGYVAKWNGSRHIMLFSPWDLDITWGMTWTGESPLLTKLTLTPDLPLLFHPELPAARALKLNVTGWREMARSRYFALRKTVLSDERLAAMLAACEADIFGSGAYLRNRSRWPTAAFAENMTDFKLFLTQRLAFMDKAIAGMWTKQ